MIEDNETLKIYDWMFKLGLRGRLLIAYAAAHKSKEENGFVNLDYVRDWCSCSKTHFDNIVVRLKEMGIIEEHKNEFYNAEDAKSFTIENSHKGRKCEWCGKESFVLNEHHYPVSFKKGGRKIVRICPNCHYTYHKVMKG